MTDRRRRRMAAVMLGAHILIALGMTYCLLSWLWTGHPPWPLH